jgi:hypothetical protein
MTHTAAVQVLQPANARVHDRLASKIVELVQGGEIDAQRLCRAALRDMRETAAVLRSTGRPCLRSRSAKASSARCRTNDQSKPKTQPARPIRFMFTSASPRSQAARLHDLRLCDGESGAHDPGKQPHFEPVRPQCLLGAPVRCASEHLERPFLLGVPPGLGFTAIARRSGSRAAAAPASAAARRRR